MVHKVLWKAAERQRARMAGLTSADLASPEWQRRIDEALMQTGFSDAAPASSLPRRHPTHLL